MFLGVIQLNYYIYLCAEIRPPLLKYDEYQFDWSSILGVLQFPQLA